MPSRNPKKDSPGRRPATTVEGQEGRMISLAMDLAEKQMKEGTASAQVISHWLKLGSTRETLEHQKLQQEVEVLRSKNEQLKSAKRSEELFEEALSAMRTYSGQEPMEEEYDD